MDFFKRLEKQQAKNGFDKGSEMRFFLDNCEILNDLPSLSFLSKASTPFDVIRANVVIRGLLNKANIEREFAKALRADTLPGEAPNPESETVREVMQELFAALPYYKCGNDYIYMPFFSKPLNRVYRDEIEKLVQPTYKKLLSDFQASVVDPFDYYGAALYRSLFTNLIEAGRNDKGEIAYLDYDGLRVYFVNSQGRLDCQLCLFDKDLHHPYQANLLVRLSPCIEAYYKCDKNAFVKELVKNKLISSKWSVAINSDEI